MPNESKVSVAERIGLSGYSTDSDGIGGIIKIRPVDFRVEEFGRKISFDPKGRFTVAKVTLNNWETNRFIGKPAKILKISRNRIWFSGTKDKRAVTQQMFVIDAPEKKISNIDILNHICSSYLRIEVKDLPGVLSSITKTFAKNKISIKNLIQKPDKKNKTATIIIITHEGFEKNFKNLISNLISNKFVLKKPTFTRVEKV